MDITTLGNPPLPVRLDPHPPLLPSPSFENIPKTLRTRQICGWRILTG